VNEQDDNPYAAPQCAVEPASSVNRPGGSLFLRTLSMVIAVTPLAIAVDAVWNIFWPTAFGGAPMVELPRASICVLWLLAWFWAMLYMAYRSRQDYNRRMQAERASL
jgi:hypothetical protein